MKNDFNGKAVLITGGTKGIGKATALAFGRLGAHCYLTHSWASADEDALRQEFQDAGAPEPSIICADASRPEDTEELLEVIAKNHKRIEVFVSNVCVVPTTEGIPSLSARALNKSLEYSAWPMIDYLQRMKKRFEGYPRYVIGTSSDGPSHYYQGYEYVALSKSVMEVFCRYLATELAGQDVRVNVVRTRNVITDSALSVHGETYPEFVAKYGGEHHFIQCEEVGNAILAVCSGLMDAMNGQILNVDRGGPFSDNLMRLYRQRDELGL